MSKKFNMKEYYKEATGREYDPSKVERLEDGILDKNFDRIAFGLGLIAGLAIGYFL